MLLHQCMMYSILNYTGIVLKSHAANILKCTIFFTSSWIVNPPHRHTLHLMDYRSEFLSTEWKSTEYTV